MLLMGAALNIDYKLPQAILFGTHACNINIVQFFGLILTRRSPYAQGTKGTYDGSPSMLPNRRSKIEQASSPLACLHILEDELEAVAESSHVWVEILLHLKGVRYNLDGPAPHLSAWTSFEAQIEVPRILGIDTERIDRASWVSFRIRSQPAFYHDVSFDTKSI
jgi:hypothetical protein